MNAQKHKSRTTKRKPTHIRAVAGESSSMRHHACVPCTHALQWRLTLEGCLQLLHTLTFQFHSLTQSCYALISAAPAFSGLCWNGCWMAESVLSPSEISAANRSERSGERGRVRLTAGEGAL
eukprot:1157400-Pelagomonas_calceolata.AAC.6